MDDLVERDGVYYKKFSDVPFTGTSRTDQQLRTYKDGKLEGLSIDYYPSGRISMIVYFKDGKQRERAERRFMGFLLVRWKCYGRYGILRGR